MVRRTIGALVIIASVIVWKWQAGEMPVGIRHPAPPQAIDPTTSGARREKPALPVSYLNNPLQFLSNAPPDSLALLPGIGPVLAERIAGARTGKRSFTRWEDLLQVRGIGPRTIDRLKALAQ
jgi:predicted flap endonuclease-1-like 5' DNA nuclease